MKRKGFTLIELLGVMTLLAIIFAFVYPNIIRMLDKGKESEYVEYESSVFLAAEAYVNSNTTLSNQLTNEGDSISISYSVLLENGFLNSKLTDPHTGQTVISLATNKVKVTVAKDKTFTYSIES